VPRRVRIFSMSDRGHTLVLCRSNNEVEAEAASRLKIGVEEILELPLVWMIASFSSPIAQRAEGLLHLDYLCV
jgi:hypothetical protein